MLVLLAVAQMFHLALIVEAAEAAVLPKSLKRKIAEIKSVIILLLIN
jgi:hypothetical protein